MMSAYKLVFRVCLSLFVVLGLSACEPKKENVVEDAASAQSIEAVSANVRPDGAAEQLLKEILLMAGTPMASKPESCQLLKLGETACGGFAHLVLYSTENANQDALLALGERYNQLVAQIQNKETNALACEAEPQVRLSLENGLCIPRQMSTF